MDKELILKELQDGNPIYTNGDDINIVFNGAGKNIEIDCGKMMSQQMVYNNGVYTFYVDGKLATLEEYYKSMGI